MDVDMIGTETLLTASAPAIMGVRCEIERIFDERMARAAGYGENFARVWEVASQCVSGGKFLRPRLFLGACEALAADGTHPDIDAGTASRIGAAIELLHYSFLLHDDVIDGDLHRRGRANLIGTMLLDRVPDGLAAALTRADALEPDARHWAVTCGVLMGDLMLAEAHQLIAREPMPHPVRLRMLDLLDHTVTESVAGEHLDAALSHGLVESDLSAVLDMDRLKTATYTFEFPLRAATILADATLPTQETIGQIGRHLGVAFQLQDDLLSTFGRASEHGKDAFSDLREGKETALIAHARTTSAWAGIAPSFGDPLLSQEGAERIRELLTGCGSRAFIEGLVETHLQAGTDLLTEPQAMVPRELADFVSRLVDSLRQRQS